MHSVTGCSTEKKIAIWIRFGLELILSITNSTQSTINLIRKIVYKKLSFFGEIFSFVSSWAAEIDPTEDLFHIMLQGFL